MKRWLAGMMTGLMLLGLMGCGGSPAAAPTPGITPAPAPQQTPGEEEPTSASVLMTDVGNKMSMMTPVDWPRLRAEEGNQVYYVYQGDATQTTLFSVSSYEKPGLGCDGDTLRQLAQEPWAAYAQLFQENGVLLEGLSDWREIPAGEDYHGMIREFHYSLEGQEIYGWYVIWNTQGRVYIGTASALPLYGELTGQMVEKALASFGYMGE
jgi:hypothetical protein